MKSVVIAEKPSVARDIARVLQCHKKGSGFLEGDKYIVTWALGHLVTLADPETYDAKYKQWNLEDLPMLPDRLKLTTIKQTSKQFHAVKAQLSRKDIKEIIIATDAGREGELVARWIIDRVRVQKPIKRLWISSVTDKAIRDGFRQLKPGKNYENLYASAVARAEADWYVGLNATRALTTKFNAQLSSGRVQTPTLAIIATREQEIKNFKPKTYYGIEAKERRGFTLYWQDEKNNSRIFSKEKADTLMKQLTDEKAVVTKIEKKMKKQFAPQLYDLTELQRDANRLFNFSAKQTLTIMQSLYERHKILTYPRTDSRFLSTDIVSTLPERIKVSASGSYGKIANDILRKNKFHQLPKSVVDNNKVSDHHAIIPTEEAVFLDELSAQERRIYDLVVKRFLAVLAEPFEFEQVTVTAEIAKEKFVAKGKVIKQHGWKAIYDKNFTEEGEQQNEQSLPVLRENEVLQVTIKRTSGETQPPSRFTEGTLLQAMENPVRYMQLQDQKLVTTIKETGGLGTVATRADIIEKLFSSMMMELKGKHIYLTAKGRQLLDLVPEDLRSPSLTAAWEQKLKQIADGKLNKAQFMKEIKAYTKQVVSEIKQSDETFKHDNLTGTNCPKCGKLMLEINNKQGKMLVCQDHSCGHKKNILKRTNARCPNCHKRLELRGEGEGQTFTCSCGHREKLSTFNKRKQHEKKHKVSKREVNQYMKKQNEEFTNNALADALAKFKK